MGWTSYFKKARREKEDFFLAFTDDELDRYNKYRTRMLIWILIGIIFSWAGVGIVILAIVLFYYIGKMRSIRTGVYRRFIKKKRQKENKVI